MRHPRKPSTRPRRRWRTPRLWPNARARRDILRVFSGIVRALRRAPLPVQALAILAMAAALWFACNWGYQVVRKPSELFFPVSGTLNKTPAETWREYGPLFRSYSTGVMSAPLLAALAQVEGSGNPVVRTYWRWSFKPRP